MNILMMLILPIHEHGTCSPLFVSSLISFLSVLWFSEYSSFTSLDKFISRYFIFLVPTVSRIIFPLFLFLQNVNFKCDPTGSADFPIKWQGLHHHQGRVLFKKGHFKMLGCSLKLQLNILKERACCQNAHLSHANMSNPPFALNKKSRQIHVGKW